VDKKIGGGDKFLSGSDNLGVSSFENREAKKSAFSSNFAKIIPFSKWEDCPSPLFPDSYSLKSVLINIQ
jgi:hypothetical protein